MNIHEGHGIRTFEPVCSPMYKLAYASIEGSVQPGHQQSSVWALRVGKGSMFLQAKLRVFRLRRCADRFKSLIYTHSIISNLYLMLDRLISPFKLIIKAK